MITLLALGCAIDTGLKGTPAVPTLDSGDPILVDDTAPPPPPEEECDGDDDDGDGLVDEDFPDADANGRADCLDVTCPALALPLGGPAEGDPACDSALVADPWRARVKWRVVAPSVDPAAANAGATPVVGHLDDDDGDGVIGPGDTPDVVVKFAQVDAEAETWLVALDGATGAEKWAVAAGGRNYHTVLADLTGDGSPEIVSSLVNGEAAAFAADGTALWEAPSSSAFGVQLHAVDLEGDGTVEIVSQFAIVEGATGSVRTWFDHDLPTHISAYRTWQQAVGDIDQDGDQEILVAGRIYDAEGALLFDTHEPLHENDTWALNPALVQADGDPEAEIAWIGEDFTVWDTDGTLLARVELDGHEPGSPCAGDLDGDGVMEIAWPDNSVMYAFELDGAPMWEAPNDDVSGMAGCSVWDMDGDGALEVIFAGEMSVAVLDGRTGARTLFAPDHRSPTLFEVPAVADVDGDGHGEILVVGLGLLGDPAAVTVLEHDGPGWSPAGTWRAHDASMSNYPDDGSVPAAPAAPWLAHGVFRGHTGHGPAADLEVAFTDVCVADCDYGPVAVGVQVSNIGTVEAPAGARLALYARDGEVEREVASVTLPAVPARSALDAVQIDLSPADVGATGFRARVDVDGAVSECDEANEATWDDAVCP